MRDSETASTTAFAIFKPKKKKKKGEPERSNDILFWVVLSADFKHPYCNANEDLFVRNSNTLYDSGCFCLTRFPECVRCW